MNTLSDKPVKMLWEHYERDQLGNDLNAELRRRLREAFIVGYMSCHNVQLNYINRLTDDEAVSYLRRVSRELETYVKEFRDAKKARKNGHITP